MEDAGTFCRWNLRNRRRRLDADAGGSGRLFIVLRHRCAHHHRSLKLAWQWSTIQES